MYVWLIIVPFQSIKVVVAHVDERAKKCFKKVVECSTELTSILKSLQTIKNIESDFPTLNKEIGKILHFNSWTIILLTIIGWNILKVKVKVLKSVVQGCEKAIFSVSTILQLLCKYYC